MEKSLEEKLQEALEILEKQSKKIQELEQELSKYRSSSENRRPLPLSSLVTEQELSEETKKNIEKAVDLILKYASNIPYLQ